MNVSLGSAEKLKTSVDYARSLTCQSRFHVAVSLNFVALFWGLKLKKPWLKVLKVHLLCSPPAVEPNKGALIVDLLNS